MATANLARKTATSKQSAASKTAKPNLVELCAAVWGFNAKVAAEQFSRDDLKDGGEYAVKLHLAAEVEGQIYQSNFEGTVSVGHASTRASSTGAPQEDVLAWVLGHVNAATRASILANLPEVYAANGEQLPVNEKDSEDAAATLKRLRAKSQQTVRGSVSVKYAAAQPSLGIVAAE